MYRLRTIVSDTPTMLDAGSSCYRAPCCSKCFPHQRLLTCVFDVELLLLAKQLSIPKYCRFAYHWYEVQESKLNVLMASLQMLRV